MPYMPPHHATRRDATQALSVTTDADHKFDLALELGKLDIGLELMQDVAPEDAETTDTQSKWKRLSDLALKQSKFEICEAASKSCSDFSGLLLLYSATGNMVGVAELAESASKAGVTNVAFTESDKCLISAGGADRALFQWQVVQR